MAMITRRCKMREFHGPTPHSIAIMARPRTNKPVDHIILEARRRAQIEDDKQATDNENVKYDLRTEWEIQSDKRVHRNRVRREVDTMMKFDEFDINDRREKLRALLEKEEADYIEEMLSKEETLLERQAKMRERARQLKDRREKERLEFVQEKYDQQFRQDCEEVRSALSKRRQDEICVSRIDQLREKDRQQMQEDQLNDLYAGMWKKDMEEKAAKEERDAREQDARNKDMLNTLQKQMAALEEQKRREAELKQEEGKLMEQQRELQCLEEQRAREFKAQKQNATRNMLDRSVALKNRLQARVQQEDMAFDLNALEKLLQETKDEEIWKRKRKAELRDEDRKYREYLQYMLDVERLKDQELDALIQTEVDKTTGKKVEKLKQERAARRKLLSEVLATRKEQVQHRINENNRKQEEARQERLDMERMIEANQMKERQDKQDMFTRRIGYRHDLNGQIMYHNSLVTTERQQEVDEYAACNKAEQEYQRKIIDLLSKPDQVRQHPMASAVLRRYEKSQ